MKTLLTLLLLVSFNCSAADDWSQADTNREVTYLIVDAMDWAQTRNIARNGTDCFRAGYTNCGETNSILGKSPSVSKVDAYFVSMALAHYAIATALPADYRAAFQYVTIGFEAGMVHRNLQLGIGVKF